MLSTNSTTSTTCIADRATTSASTTVSDALSFLVDSTLNTTGIALNTCDTFNITVPAVHDASGCFFSDSLYYTPAKIYAKMPPLPVIEEVIFHDGTHTTIRWADGTATDVSCGEGEEYNEYEGFCAAVVKKLFGGTGVAKRVMHENNLTEQRRIAKEIEAKKRQEEAEAIARKKARAKRSYIKKMAKKMLIEEEIRRQAEELAKKMNEGTLRCDQR